MKMEGNKKKSTKEGESSWRALSGYVNKFKKQFVYAKKSLFFVMA
jgi:hypothetical protein